MPPASPAGISGMPPSRWIELEGGPLHYVEWPGSGSGRAFSSGTTTFVLIHGLGGSHVNWAAVGDELATRGRVVAIDLAGFGLTPRAGRPSTMQANRRLLGAFLREVAPRAGDERVVLIGNSMGGGLAILQAAIEPSSVSGIVLTGTIVPWARGGWPAPQVTGMFLLYKLPVVGVMAGKLRMTALDPKRIVETGFRLTTANPQMIDPAIVDMHVEMATRRAKATDAPAAFVEAARSLLRLGARPAIAHTAMDAVACPVLMMHGAKDKLVPIEYADAAARREPTWRYRRFDEHGHVIQLEAPKEWLETVGEWLDEQGF